MMRSKKYIFTFIEIGIRKIVLYILQMPMITLNQIQYEIY